MGSKRKKEIKNEVKRILKEIYGENYKEHLEYYRLSPEDVEFLETEIKPPDPVFLINEVLKRIDLEKLKGIRTEYFKEAMRFAIGKNFPTYYVDQMIKENEAKLKRPTIYSLAKMIKNPSEPKKKEKPKKERKKEKKKEEKKGSPSIPVDEIIQLVKSTNPGSDVDVLEVLLNNKIHERYDIDTIRLALEDIRKTHNIKNHKAIAGALGIIKAVGYERIIKNPEDVTEEEIHNTALKLMRESQIPKAPKATNYALELIERKAQNKFQKHINEVKRFYQESESLVNLAHKLYLRRYHEMKNHVLTGILSGAGLYRHHIGTIKMIFEMTRYLEKFPTTESEVYHGVKAIGLKKNSQLTKDLIRYVKPKSKTGKHPRR